MFKLSSCGLPNDFVVPVEAIRYTYLKNIYCLDAINKNLDRPLNIYCFTDILAESAFYQFNFLEMFVKKYSDTLSFNIIIKPHPFLRNCEEIAEKCLVITKYKIVTSHLSELVGDIDMAILHSTGGVCVDLAYMGIPFVILRDPKILNLSPVFGREFLFISSIDDLNDSIGSRKKLQNYLQTEFNAECDFFYLDENLPRWQALLQKMMC